VSVRRYLVGLVGDGIGASLTPELHMREARRLGLDYDYRLLDLEAGEHDASDLVDFLRRLADEGYSAVNVTHPFKQRVMASMDDLSPEARRIGAVNLVLFRDGRMHGHNTDWTGFRSALLQDLAGEPRETVLQFGAGGAGLATAYAVLSLGTASVVVHDVDVAHAKALADKYRPHFPEQTITATNGSVDPWWESLDGVIHATPLGMAHHPGMAFDPSRLALNAWLAEVVYRPIETELLRKARATGRRVLDGGPMAVGQAVDSLRLITGREPVPARMRADFQELLCEDADTRRAGPS
jgi:shikimate dehydrogenase